MKPLQIYITQDMHQQLKVKAAERGLSMSDIVTPLIQRALEAEAEPTLRPGTVAPQTAQKIKKNPSAAHSVNWCKVHDVEKTVCKGFKH